MDSTDYPDSSGYKNTRALESVGEFFAALQAPDPERGVSLKYDWVYRGSRIAEWDLSPLALRCESLGLPKATAGEQGQAQFDLLRKFFQHCDHSGLAVPGDCHQLRETLAEGRRESASSWMSGIPPELYGLAGIAQHHGVPTPLLDWSWNPLTAAYFACRDIEPDDPADDAPPDCTGLLCVWALHTSLFEHFRRDAELPSSDPGRIVLERVSVPTASNPNLRAQEGVFTKWTSGEVYRLAPGDPPPPVPGRPTMDETFNRDEHHAYREHLVKLTLPRAAATELYERLRVFGISRSTLFPGYDACAKSATWDVLRSQRGD